MSVRTPLNSVLVGLLGASLLTACVQQPPRSDVRVIEDRSVPAPEATGTTPAEPRQPAPAAPPQPVRKLADGSQLPAVKGLLGAADQALLRGDVELASASLERAQRLAPQSALVYQRLAKVRLKQKRPAEAEQLARKALAFAASPSQQAELWRLIASARQQQGKPSGATEANARAAALESGVLGGAP